MKQFFCSRAGKCGVLLGFLLLPLLGMAQVNVIQVDDNSDTDDGRCTTGDCTLREAINLANNSNGNLTIQFNLNSQNQIVLNSLLPTIGSAAITIDGSNISGPNVIINGGNRVSYGLSLGASRCAAYDLTIRGCTTGGLRVTSSAFGTIVGNSGRGIVAENNGTGILVQGNSCALRGNVLRGNTNAGIWVSRANGCTIGESTTNPVNNTFISNGVGVLVSTSGSAAILGNVFYCNDLGIRLTSGGNGGKSPPTITDVDEKAVSGRGEVTARIQVYVFRPGYAGCDEEQGNFLLGTTFTDGQGNWTLTNNNFNFSLQSTDRVVATQSDEIIFRSNLFAANTSPFSAAVALCDLYSVSAAVSDQGCPGEAFTLEATRNLEVPGNFSPPATYTWSGPGGVQTGNPVSFTTPGTYTVTMTTACQTETATVTVEQENIPTTISVNSTSPVCEGGSLLLSTRNFDGWSYEWTGPNNFRSTLLSATVSQNATTDMSGTYTLQTTTAEGCTGPTAELEVVVVANPTAEPTDLLACQDEPGGMIYNLREVDSLVNPDAVGSVVWFSDPTDPDAIITNPANYFTEEDEAYAEVQTEAGCTSDRVVVSLDTTLGVQASLDILSEPTCEDLNAGALLLVIDQGIPPYTIDWNVDELDGQTEPEGLGPGLYEVTVTGANGCSDVQEWQLVAPAGFDLSCTILDTVDRVGESTGRVAFFYTGLEGSATLSWEGPVSGNRPARNGGLDSLSNLPAGDYIFTLTDEGGCSAFCSLTINEPNCSNFSMAAEWRDPRCAGEPSGQIFLFFSEENEPFTYDWDDDNLDGLETPDSLLAGTYSVTVTDDRGCVDSLTIELPDPPALELTCAVIQSATDFSTSDGIASFTLVGGIGAKVFMLEGPLSLDDTLVTDTILTIENLPAGDYEVFLTDFNGCTETCRFTVNLAICDDLVLDVVSQGASCAGETDGRIEVFVGGGEAPYFYEWNVRGVPDTNVLTGVLPGTYSVTILDSRTCNLTAEATIEEPDALTLSCLLQTTTSTVGGDDGVVQYTLDGGTAPYAVSWSGAATGSRTISGSGNAILDGLPEGNLQLLVTDANGCQDRCEVTITGPDCTDLRITAAATQASCEGVADGQVQTTVFGGQGPFSYAWSQDTLSDQADQTGLRPGVYGVTVTDARGCTAESAASVGAASEAPEAFIGSGGTVCSASCLVLPVEFAGTPPFRLQYRLIGPDGSEQERELTSETAGTSLAICPSEEGFTEGSIRLVLDRVFDNNCVADIFGESLINIQSPGRAVIDTVLCLTDFITVNGRIYDRNNPFGTELLPAGAANGCDSIIDVTLTFLPQPDVTNLLATCDFDTETYQISFDLIGTGPFQVVGLNGSIGAGRFTSNPMTARGIQQWTVLDARGCSREVELIGPDCNREGNCPVVASDILDVQTDGCAADTVRVRLTGQEDFPAGFGQELVFHTGSVNELGAILRRSSDTTIVFGPPMTLGENYHLAVIAGPIVDGRVDVNDPCLSVALGPNVSFRDGPATPAFIQGQDTLCVGEELLLFTEDLSAAQYVWYLPSGKTDTTSNRLLRIPDVQVEDIGPYYVQAFNGDCASARFGPQYFSILPFPTVDAGMDRAECSRDGIVLQAADPAPLSGRWEALNMANFIVFPDSATTQVDNLSPGLNTFVWSVANDQCAVSDTVQVSYATIPVLVDDTWRLNETSSRITFDAFRNDQLEGFPLNSTTVSVVEQPEAGIVNFFDQEDVFEFTYELSGLSEVIFEYAVCSEACGVCDTASVLIALPDVFLIIPEGITPNDDGRNDLLRIENIEAYPDNEVVIVNRWGQTVFRQQNYSNDNPWDGSHNGNPLPQGTYYVVVRVEGRETVVRKTVHLINRTSP